LDSDVDLFVHITKHKIYLLIKIDRYRTLISIWQPTVTGGGDDKGWSWHTVCTNDVLPTPVHLIIDRNQINHRNNLTRIAQYKNLDEYFEITLLNKNKNLQSMLVYHY
jgi:hypothetical protein